LLLFVTAPTRARTTGENNILVVVVVVIVPFLVRFFVSSLLFWIYYESV